MPGSSDTEGRVLDLSIERLRLLQEAAELERRLLEAGRRDAELAPRRAALMMQAAEVQARLGRGEHVPPSEMERLEHALWDAFEELGTMAGQAIADCAALTGKVGAALLVTEAEVEARAEALVAERLAGDLGAAGCASLPH